MHEHNETIVIDITGGGRRPLLSGFYRSSLLIVQGLPRLSVSSGLSEPLTFFGKPGSQDIC